MIVELGKINGNYHVHNPYELLGKMWSIQFIRTDQEEQLVISFQDITIRGFIMDQGRLTELFKILDRASLLCWIPAKKVLLLQKSTKSGDTIECFVQDGTLRKLGKLAPALSMREDLDFRRL